MTERNTCKSSGSDLKQFLLNLDDDMSKWPEWRKRPESSPVKHNSTDFMPPNRSVTLGRKERCEKDIRRR